MSQPSGAGHREPGHLPEQRQKSEEACRSAISLTRGKDAADLGMAVYIALLSPTLHPEFAREPPNFIAEIKRIFEPREIREYLENIRRVGALGHVCTDEDVEVFRAAGAIDEDPVRGAEDVIIVERIKELLFD